MDNSHYYERHFGIASKIINESGTNYSFILKEPMFNIDEDDMFFTDTLTDSAKNFIKSALELKQSGENKRSAYIKKLQEFFIIETQ